jgi:nicotinamidase-related amidase
MRRDPARANGLGARDGSVRPSPSVGRADRGWYSPRTIIANTVGLVAWEGDIVIEGKRGLDTFASTNLDFILRSKGIKTVVLGGFLTNICVESTMRTAYERGFEVITLTDCVAATSPEEHHNAIKYDFPMFSTPMPSSQLKAQLS